VISMTSKKEEKYHLVKSLSDSVADMLQDRSRIEMSPDSSVTDHKVNSSLGVLGLAKSNTSMVKPGSMNLPPPLHLFHPVTRTVRFATTASIDNVSPSPNQILSCFVAVTLTSTSAVSVHSRYRVRRVRMWPPAGGEASLAWQSNAQFSVPDEVVNTSLPTGITVTKCFSWTPPKDSMINSWQPANSSTSLGPFTYTATTGTIIDLDVELSQTAFLTVPVLTCVSLSSGTMYYGYLGSSLAPPVAFPNSSLFT